MNYKLLSLCIIVIVVCTILLHHLGGEAAGSNDGELTRDTVCVDVPENNFVYGRLGDGTGMSCFEFVTTNGDTLMLSKTSELTGEDVVLLGSDIMDENTVFAMRLTDDNEAAAVAVNMTQLRTRWQADGNGFVLAADSTVANVGKENSYRRWVLSDDKLVLTRSVRHEGGLSETTDTLKIVSLSADTLVLRDMFGKESRLTHGTPPQPSPQGEGE